MLSIKKKTMLDLSFEGFVVNSDGKSYTRINFDRDNNINLMLECHYVEAMDRFKHVLKTYDEPFYIITDDFSLWGLDFEKKDAEAIESVISKHNYYSKLLIKHDGESSFRQVGDDFIKKKINHPEYQYEVSARKPKSKKLVEVYIEGPNEK